jgi:hypothetical protein
MKEYNMGPLIPIAISLASKFAPALLGKLFGDDAEKTAKKVTDVAQIVTGAVTPQEAQAVIEQDPEVAAKFQERMKELELEFYREDTARFKEIHETIRTELSSKDTFARRWRPFYGYCVAGSWILMFVTLFAGFIYGMTQDKLDTIISAYSELAAAVVPLWGIALTVLGYNIRKRSQDKEVAAGEKEQGLLASMIQAIKK